jgi:2-octaprenylphenol hydroxylase
MSNTFDIIIIGGGMVGASLACALGDSRLKVAVVEGEATPLTWPRASYDIRVSAITRASQHFFENLGVWEAMRAERVAAYGEMRVWDATGTGSIHFDAAEIGEPDLGHIIENRVITKALVQRARAFDNVRWLFPAAPQRLLLRTNHAQLQLADGSELRAELLVGADGGRSWIRQQVGIHVHTQHYEQSALVTTVKTERYHNDTAWQRFLPTGPLAFLPLTEGHSSIVWSTTPEEAERLLELGDEAFTNELEKAFESRLGAITELGPRAVFPLKGQHAEHYVLPHLALIGDAAHTIHPLAGQGVNLGFADAATLAEVILEAHAANKPIGAYKTLRRYERSRRGDNQLMLDSMDAFKRLFSNETPLLRTARNLGLDLTDRLPAVKRLFMSQALGTGGEQATLMRETR